jgi:hypothetical protein
MRRLLFYFSVLLLAFGIGLSFIYFKFSNSKESFVVFPFEIKTDAQSISSRQNEGTKTENLQTKFVCENKTFLFILNRLQKSLEEKEFINDFIREKRINNCDELFEIRDRLDLNGDGKEESIVKAKNSPKGMFYCGATGNCSTWILSRRAKTFRVILDAGSIEEINTTKGKSKGFLNLTLRGHSGAMNHYIGDYEFNGKEYKLKKCSEEITQTNKSNFVLARKISDCK